VTPINPPWRTMLRSLHRRLGSYPAIARELDLMGAPCDQSSLQHLTRGQINHPRWTTGAAILNLYARYGGRIDSEVN
jgi:hypothetical protein